MCTQTGMEFSNVNYFPISYVLHVIVLLSIVILSFCTCLCNIASWPLVKSLTLAGGLLSNLSFTGATSPADNALKYLKEFHSTLIIHDRVWITHAADHSSRSGGCVSIAAFVKSFKMLGSNGGILICSTQYNGLLSGSMLPWKLTTFRAQVHI